MLTEHLTTENLEEMKECEPLIKDCGSHENINLSGLRRGHKQPTMEVHHHVCVFSQSRTLTFVNTLGMETIN